MQAIDARAADVGTPESLVARAGGGAGAGDHAAFEAIFNRYQAPVYDYVRRVVDDEADAYHVTQDAFLAAYLSLPRASDGVRIDLWLYRIATRACLDALRWRRRVARRPWNLVASALRFRPGERGRAQRQDPHRPRYREAGGTDDVQQLLVRMRPKSRVCLVLREQLGLSYEEMAEVLGATRGAVVTLLLRARQGLGCSRSLGPSTPRPLA